VFQIGDRQVKGWAQKIKFIESLPTKTRQCWTYYKPLLCVNIGKWKTFLCV